ncbi:hypothetical protein DMC30DRAFT_258622 [Rhodotorula diobovata]|uniref:Uncharacterized protein n=1 Tax=Rhodotorula diobovata TaxID=5288 RepID=A0A5C5G407_9BASI|nr:hypothetical protein DMC30DRAFT_258622 [Rhodotorula diobovata]
MPSSTAPSTRAAHRHKGAASSQPTSGLVAIRARHAFQCSHALTISAFVSLLSDLNSSWEVDHRRGTQLSRDDRIASFREDWLMGLLARVRPLQLLADDECETYSDGNASPSSRRSSSLAPSVVTTSSSSDHDDNNDDAVVLPAEARQHLVPPDAMSRGVLAERTIKRALSLRRQLLPHRDLSSLASVARRAMRQTLATGRPVFVAPGLVDSVDWTGEYRERGWAAPGVRWGVFRPDLIRFEEVKRRGAGEEGERLVSWEVVEVKWSGKANDFVRPARRFQADSL